MNYNIDNFKGLKAKKLRSQTFTSLLDAVESRCKIEKTMPTFSFCDHRFGSKLKFSAKTFYTSDGFDFVDIDKIHNSSDISLVVNKNRLEAFLEDNNNENFENISQALSVLAVGNVHDILRSEQFIKATLNKNKIIKKNEITKSTSFRLGTTASTMKDCFGEFTRNVEFLFEEAHKYASAHPTM